MSKSKENENICPAFRTSIGGQALMEGIMMKGPEKQVAVCRTKDGLVMKEEPIKADSKKFSLKKLPFIRGTFNFVSTMVVGVKFLTWSAEQLPEEEQEEPGKIDKWIMEHFSEEKANKLIIGIAVVLGIALSVGMFILLPTLLATFLLKFIESHLVVNICEGVLRIIIFLLYMWLVSKLDDIKRLWMYHGAEHKTIFCYESGLELTVENARKMPRQHPRCGTSFMFLVMIISILVFSVASGEGGLWENPFVRMGIRLLLLPIVVGISYEMIKYAGRHDNLFTRIMSAPGKALQRLTTAEPDDDMLEVAIEAMKQVIPEKKGTDAW